jgi:hypothetical protein
MGIQPQRYQQGIIKAFSAKCFSSSNHFSPVRNGSDPISCSKPHRETHLFYERPMQIGKSYRNALEASACTLLGKLSQVGGECAGTHKDSGSEMGAVSWILPSRRQRIEIVSLASSWADSFWRAIGYRSLLPQRLKEELVMMAQKYSPVFNTITKSAPVSVPLEKEIFKTKSDALKKAA